jgi:hypothetical protein
MLTCCRKWRCCANQSDVSLFGMQLLLLVMMMVVVIHRNAQWAATAAQMGR